ncbi:hypothetical protein BJ166DRAFT_494121 [Pestalotiopsis sp. NC0098]|nr:hypothetical protein BJ166DRAFT_494121 [Pestalotiopsis sp. NC0098]
MSEARSKKACRVNGYSRARISILGLDPNPCATGRRDAKICPSLKGKLAGPCKKAATSSMLGLTSMSMLAVAVFPYVHVPAGVGAADKENMPKGTAASDRRVRDGLVDRDQHVSMPSPAEICKGKLKQESQGLPGNKKQGPVDSLTGPDGQASIDVL